MYRSTGFISFFLRRLTGVALVLYLFLHMWVIGSALQGPEVFNARLNLVQSPLFKLMEIALLAAVVYHAFDGIRLLVVHWFDVTSYRKSLFYAAFVVSAILVIAGGIPILLFMFEG
ncbi:MAG: succinate dehydrogenase, cytochrome b556 subunit [Caldilineaceae bacterium]|nr:succinate dehydrogenase, cytochrome b556 subunit [Caldilineaceae bacterium]MCB9162210.1 succinate dehydrogenase, cytochrome b556 subunit [Caldilineaceae bacterium]